MTGTAEPAALGRIRAAMSTDLGKAVTAEVPKDLTKVPLADLPKHFADVLAL